MTYHARTPIRRYAKRRPPMAGWLDDALDIFIPGRLLNAGPDNAQCLEQANAAVAPFDAKVNDLARTWNPTGFYTSADVRSLVSSTMLTIQQGQAALDLARAEPNASQDTVLRATDDLARAGQRSLDYLQAAQDADASGLRTINAPGLKRWVTDSMGAASSAITTAAMIGCITPWWVGALAQFQAAFDSAVIVAKKVVGAVIAVGEQALEVVENLPAILTYLKWGGIAYGLYWLWTNRKGLL